MLVSLGHCIFWMAVSAYVHLRCVLLSISFAAQKCSPIRLEFFSSAVDKRSVWVEGERFHFCRFRNKPDDPYVVCFLVMSVCSGWSPAEEKQRTWKLYFFCCFVMGNDVQRTKEEVISWSQWIQLSSNLSSGAAWAGLCESQCFLRA